MEITYRRVHLDNIEEMQFIAAIDTAIPAKFDPIFQVNEKTISERLEQLMKCQPNDFFEVAVNENERIVAFHYLNQFKGPHGILAASITTLWVAPEYRRQGIAKTLKERGEIWAKENNLDHISTFVHANNSSMPPVSGKLSHELKNNMGQETSRKWDSVKSIQQCLRMPYE